MERIDPIKQSKDPITIQAEENFKKRLEEDSYFRGLVGEMEQIINQSLPYDYLRDKVENFNKFFQNAEYIEQLQREAEKENKGFFYSYIEVDKFKGKNREGNDIEIKINMAGDGKSIYAEIKNIEKK